MTVVGLISENDEVAFGVIMWTNKIKKIKRQNQSLLNGSSVEIVQNTKFFGVNITEDLAWPFNTSTIIKKAEQIVPTQILYILQREY